MKKILVIMLGMALLLSGCQSNKGEIKISGGTAHLKVMKVVAQKLMKDNPGLKISIAGGGSGVGIKQVGEGIVDIGNAGRKMKEKETNKYTDLIQHKIAIDAIAIVVNPESKINGISKEDLKKIYAGKITNWKELGSSDSKINVYTRDEESGTRSTFWKKGLNKGDIIKSAQFVKSNGDMKVNVARDKYAIGYMSAGNVDNSVKAIAFDNVNPTNENIKSGKYTIQRGLFSITKGKPQKNTKLFIDTLLSEWGQNVIKEHKFLPVK